MNSEELFAKIILDIPYNQFAKICEENNLSKREILDLLFKHIKVVM
jgi:hypothetical protein